MVTKNIELGRKFLKIQIPNEWSSSKLGDFATIHGRIGWKNLRADEYTQSGPLMLSVWSLVDSVSYGVDFSRGIHRLSEFRYEESPEIKLEKGDVLIAKDGDIGRIGFIKKLLEPTTVNSHVVVVRIKKSSVFPEYLYWFTQFKHFQSYCVAFTSGTTVPLLTQKDLKNAIIPLPPEREQKKISSILSNVDSLILSYDNIIEKTVVLRKGLMRQLLTKGIGHTKFKKVKWNYGKLLSIPDIWKIELLDNVTIRGSGHTPDAKIPEYYDGGIKWISLADSNKLDNVYISETEKEISQKGIDNSSAVIHQSGTVVLSRDAGIGKSAITTKEMAVSQHFMAWKCGEKLDNHFLYYLLQFWKPLFENIAIGTTIKTIGLPFFKKFRIILPPLIEQKNISEILLILDKEIWEFELKKSQLQTLKKGLMQKLLTGQIRVKV